VLAFILLELCHLPLGCQHPYLICLESRIKLFDLDLEVNSVIVENSDRPLENLVVSTGRSVEARHNNGGERRHVALARRRRRHHGSLVAATRERRLLQR